MITFNSEKRLLYLEYQCPTRLERVKLLNTEDCNYHVVRVRFKCSSIYIKKSFHKELPIRFDIKIEYMNRNA